MGNSEKVLKESTPKFKAKLRDIILDYIRKEGFELIDIKTGNGYFLFDFGDNSVTHFKIKQCGKRWLFGLWITDVKKSVKNEETGETEYPCTGEVTVELFGENIDYIDKFKPSATEIHTDEQVISKEDCSHIRFNPDKFDPTVICYQIIDHIKRIAYNPIFARCYYYFDPYYKSNMAWWYIKDMWFYRVDNNIRKWWEHHSIKVYLHAIKLLYKVRFGNKIDVDINYRPDIWPMYEFRVIYEKILDKSDLMKHVYSVINMSKNGKSRYWLIPYWQMFSQVRLQNCETMKDYRGFYYKTEEYGNKEL